MKVRDVRDASTPKLDELSRASQISTVRWSIPGTTATEIIDLATGSPRLEGLDVLRMISIDCNAPAVKGYSACCWERRIINVAVHTDHDANFYTDYDSYSSKIQKEYDDLVWIYMPIDEGEIVERIYRRVRTRMRDEVSVPGPYGTDLGLIVSVYTHALYNKLTHTIYLVLDKLWQDNLVWDAYPLPEMAKV